MKTPMVIRARDDRKACRACGHLGVVTDAPNLTDWDWEFGAVEVESRPGSPGSGAARGDPTRRRAAGFAAWPRAPLGGVRSIGWWMIGRDGVEEVPVAALGTHDTRR